MDAQRTAEEARKTATLNNITNCKYFDGSPEVVLHKVAENIKYNKACAVMICGGNNISACECLHMLDIKEVLFPLPGYSAHCKLNA